MQKIVDLILNNSKTGTLSDYELKVLLSGSANKRHSLVKRALAKGDILQLRRGLYSLPNRLSAQRADPFELAQRIYGPSYISLESALAYHGWIPEAVYAVTSVSAKRSVEFKTPLGIFSYKRIPSHALYAGVARLSSPRGTFFLAGPLKALADYVYAYKKTWRGLKEAARDLRLDDASVRKLKRAEVDELLLTYGNRRVERYLQAIRKELKR